MMGMNRLVIQQISAMGPIKGCALSLLWAGIG
ncbi:hypothetical protein MCEMSEM18_01800 [Comamonadaceae bacterium]